MAEKLVQIGMRAAIRDVQDYVRNNQFPVHVQGRHDQDPFKASLVDTNGLDAYLMAMLITAGAFEDLSDEDEPDDEMPAYLTALKERSQAFGRRGGAAPEPA